jgi:hypothetical protein
VGLAGNQRSTAEADRMLAETAAQAPYAPTARFFARVWGEGLSAMRPWLAVQRSARELKAGRSALRRSVFEDGELPGWERPAPAFVGLEADSTMLAAWRQRERKHEVYVGISYTGKDQHGRRARLADKGLSFGLRGSVQFGQDFFAMAQERHNVVEAGAGVFLSDGAECLRNIQREHFPRHVRQLDWRHVGARLTEAYGPTLRERSAELLRLLYAGERQAVCRQVRQDGQRYRGRREHLRDLAGYLEGPGEDLYGSRRLRKAGVELPPRLQGSGGIERNVDVLVGQRMKRRGMSWTLQGAENLLAVRHHLLQSLNESSSR